MSFGSFALTRPAVAAAALALALSACGGGGGGSSTQQSANMPGNGSGSGGGGGGAPGAGGGAGGGETPAPAPIPGNAAAVESAVRLAAAHNDADSAGWNFSRTDAGSGSSSRVWSQSHQTGRSISTAAPWSAGGELQFLTLMNVLNTPYRRNPDVWTGRFVDTAYDAAGVTITRAAAGSASAMPGWRGLHATAAQNGGGALNVRFFTDATDAELRALRSPFVGNDEEFSRVIALDDPPIPAIPADRGYFYILLPDAGLSGTLDGAAGRFACAADGCALAANLHPEAGAAQGYFPADGNVVFTPDGGGAATTLEPGTSATVPKAGYLTFGHWLYVPEDAAAAADYDFGVFAGGDDPFTVGNLAALTGRAEYSGEAAGVWASGSATDRFTANVALVAEFGDATAFGRISGSVSGFALEGGGAPPFATLELASVSYRDSSGAANVFATYATGAENDEPEIPGGWVEGTTSGGAGSGWAGVWGGQFFGNGDSAADHPSDFAGTFGAVHASQGSVAGSFGTHKGASSPGGDRPPEPGAAAVESAVRLVAASSDEGAWGWNASWTSADSGSSSRVWSQYHEGGWSSRIAAPWSSANGELQFVTVVAHDTPYRRNPDVWTGRFVDTAEDAAGIAVTRAAAGSAAAMPGWRGLHATSTQNGGGALNVRFFTDATDAELRALRRPFVGNDEGFTRVIALDDPPVPAIPADRGYFAIDLPDAGLSGTLDGAAGSFACAAAGCGLAAIKYPEAGSAQGWYPYGGNVVFTPDGGGAATTLEPGTSAAVPQADYLSFGHWLYVPEDATAAADYDFGVFAGGDDPFTVGNLAALTGRAEYSGEAAGVWASGSATVHFTANAALTAEFGDATAFGRISGSVSGFALEGGGAPPFAALELASASHRDSSGAANVFATYSAGVENNEPEIPGGWVEGTTTGGAGSGWAGVWGGQFFGNGDSASDHPSGFAGTFGAVHASQGSVAGSFGTHKR